MKNIFKLLFVLIATSALLMSCDKEPFSDSSNNAANLNAATYYVQFKPAPTTALETKVNDAGDLIDVSSKINVGLMGVPQKQDIVVELSIDPSSTIDPSMYTIGSMTVTIPAGKTSASTTISTVVENMPIATSMKLVVNMTVSGTPAPAGLSLTYSFFRINFCPLTNGASDLVGTWSGSDAWYGSGFTAVLNGVDKLDISGLSEAFMVAWWGENVVAGGTCTATINGNGTLDIPRQYIYDSDWDSRYEVEGTGKWDNCDDAPHMVITYDIYYEGDADGLGKTYSPAYLPTPYLTADVVLSGSKKAVVGELPIKIVR